MKKGQATIFIIVGLIIIVIGIGSFFIYNRIAQEQAKEARRVVEEVPQQFVPVKSFTEDCLKTTAENGLQLLGQQGGYIYPERKGLLFDEQSPTDSDGLVIGQIKVPYWLYNAPANQRNTIDIKSLSPQISDMEAELEDFIEANVQSCLDYSGFQDFTVQQSEEYNVLVNIVPGQVKFSIVHPLTISTPETQIDMQNFYNEIDLDLAHLHQIAQKITLAQSNFSFLEQNTLSLITIFSNPDRDSLPPMTDSTFETGNIPFWYEQDVIEDVREMLMTYTSFLQYHQSLNYKPAQHSDALSQRVYSNMVLPLDGAQDLEVRFAYLDWPLYFDANARNGLIRPQSAVLDFIGLFKMGIQRYKTVYDISWPVYINLHDPQALNGRGYDFNFALEANIRNNRPIEDGQVLFGPVESFTESLTCQENQKNSGNITVYAYDAYTHEPLDDASVTFSIGDETCLIDSTFNGTLISPFPIAYGGLVGVSKENYRTRYVSLDTSLDQEDNLRVGLYPYKNINATIKKIQLINCKGPCSVGPFSSSPIILAKEEPLGKDFNIYWTYNNFHLPLTEDESSIITLNSLEELQEGTTVALGVTGQQTNPIRIAPGRYELTMNSLLEDILTIPPDERDIEGQTVYLPNETIVFDSFHYGMATFNIEVEPTHLYQSDLITFYVITNNLKSIPPEQRLIEDTYIATGLDDLTPTLRPLLQPSYE